METLDARRASRGNAWVWKGGEEDFRVLTVRAGNRGGGRVLTKEHERGRVRPAVALKVCSMSNTSAGENDL